jgi:glycosyltransferase involved in cell wall biosynthesis
MDLRTLSILDLRDTHEIGGPGKTILESYRAVDHERFRLHLGYFQAPGVAEDSPFLAAARAIGLPVHPIAARGPYDLAQVWRLVDLVRTQKFDIVHPHEVSSDVVTLAMRALVRVPIVSTVHGWIGNTAKDRFMNALDKRVLRRFDRVIAVSEQIQQDLLESGVPARSIRVLHNAIVLDKYRRVDGGGSLASLVTTPLPRPVMVSIGRLSQEKGHADLVEALRLVAAQGRHITTVLAGDGPSRGDLERQIQAAGLQQWVHLLGYVAEPARLLQDADLVVLPSHTEGLPNAALEAFAMEVPLLATRVGGTPEVVTDGETGRLVPARTPAALAAGILDFLNDPAKWRGWAGRARQVVEDRFDFKTRTRTLEALYRELADEHS